MRIMLACILTSFCYVCSFDASHGSAADVGAVSGVFIIRVAAAIVRVLNHFPEDRERDNNHQLGNIRD